MKTDFFKILTLCEIRHGFLFPEVTVLIKIVFNELFKSSFINGRTLVFFVCLFYFYLFIYGMCFYFPLESCFVFCFFESI